MTELDKLDNLINVVEDGEDYVERHIQRAFGGYRSSANSAYINRAYHGSLDAALSLHEALLPGWYWSATKIGRMVVTSPDLGAEHDGLLDSDHDVMPPARAWLLAILRAYRSVQA